MKIVKLEELDSIAATNSLVTIGTFDGVHLGHQMLLQSVVEHARESKQTSVVVTFEPIPASILRPDTFPGRICSFAEKMEVIVRFGLDHVIVLEFDRALAERSPEQFMTELTRATSLKNLWIGEAFALGKGRTGGVERLTEIGQELGYAVSAMSRSEDIDGVISSTRIRHAIQLGDVSLANRLLGRPFRIEGEVIYGAQFGRTIGFPTANVNPPPDQVALADGIYASRVTLPGETIARQAMTYVGTRPSVNTGARQIETNLLDFSQDIYGKIITVELMQRLRPDAFFPTIDELVAQLCNDESATRAFFVDLEDGFD